MAAAMLAAGLALVLPPLLHSEGEEATSGPSARERWPAALVALAVPLLSIALYAMLGNPRALAPPQPLQAGAVGPEQVEAMVARLAAKLQAQPDDAGGWRMLARSYETLRRFEPAADAYRHLLALDPDNPDVLVDYAVVLGMTLERRLVGEPVRLIERALAIDANHVQALALLGSAALERGDHAAAIKLWKKILALVPAQSDMGRAIADSIAKAETAQR